MYYKIGLKKYTIKMLIIFSRSIFFIQAGLLCHVILLFSFKIYYYYLLLLCYIKRLRKYMDFNFILKKDALPIVNMF